jgi:hypothetical protein
MADRRGAGPAPISPSAVDRPAQTGPPDPLHVVRSRRATSAALRRIPAQATTGLEDITLTTAHRTIVIADIEGFGQLIRTNINQVRVRRGMYRALEHAFEVAGIPWASCGHEDRGDGVLILVPAEIPKRLFVERMPEALVEALARHNRMHPTAEQIRLRLALHAGEINYDEHGVTGSSITRAFRLLDADVLRAALAASSALLAIIGSGWFFDEVIRHSEHSHAGAYRPAEVTNKEVTTQAWIRLVKAQAVPHRRPTHAPTVGGIRWRRRNGGNQSRR